MEGEWVGDGIRRVFEGKRVWEGRGYVVVFVGGFVVGEGVRLIGEKVMFR
ncbi:hypothetical protein [Bacillus sp. WP8]|nr:hypothetical protein [Bacillus sp. WP8]